ncbi:hypothetical protein KW464_22180 [Vibrio fluvialis]|nr:hypothetical protein [Vibrio fluvialis]
MEKINFTELHTQVIGYGPHKPQVITANCDAHPIHAFFKNAPASSSVSNHTTLKQNLTLSNATVLNG